MLLILSACKDRVLYPNESFGLFLATLLRAGVAGKTLEYVKEAAGRKVQPFLTMANTILVGAQWGDEGKGKIIDVLTAEAISSFAAARE